MTHLQGALIIRSKWADCRWFLWGQRWNSRRIPLSVACYNLGQKCYQCEKFLNKLWGAWQGSCTQQQANHAVVTKIIHLPETSPKAKTDVHPKMVHQHFQVWTTFYVTAATLFGPTNKAYWSDEESPKLRLFNKTLGTAAGRSSLEQWPRRVSRCRGCSTQHSNWKFLACSHLAA